MDISLKDKIENIVNRENLDDDALVFKLKKLLYEMERQKNADSISEKLSELFLRNLENMRKMKDESHIIRTGFDDFDKIFGGFLLSEYIVIGGVSAIGKTQFLVNLTLNISNKLPVLYFTFDLSVSRLTNRFISSVSEISIDKLLYNELSEDERKKLIEIQEEIDNRKVYINESYKDSISNLLTHCKKQVEEKGIQVIIIDSLQQMTSSRYSNNRDVELSYINRELRNFAKDYQVCVIASSQLNRAVSYRQGLYGKIPQLSDLRESGSTEQEADKVLFIHRPDYYQITEDKYGNSLNGVVNIAVAKNRNGKTGNIKLIINESGTKFRTNDQFSFSPNRLDELNTPY